MVEVNIDGASAGDPGYSGAGIFINYKKGEVESFAIPLGIMSNHEAEYEALIHALDLCLARDLTIVSVRTDSQLLVDAVENRHIKNKRFQPYLQRVLKRVDQFHLFFIKWIPSNKNRQADQLAKSAIRKNNRTTP